MLEIYVWPDGTWMFKEDYCAIVDLYKGDDFFSLFVEEYLEYDEIDRLASEAV